MQRLGYISHNGKILTIINSDNITCLSFLSILKTILLELLPKHLRFRAINMTDLKLLCDILIQSTVLYVTLGVLSRDDVRKTEGVCHAQSRPVH